MALRNGSHGATFAEMRTKFKFGLKSQIDRRLSRDITTFHICGVVYWLSYGLNVEESFDSLLPCWGRRVFPSPKHSDRLWDPPAFLFNCYGGRFPAVRPPQSVKMTTQLVPKLRMTGAVPPLLIRLVYTGTALLGYVCIS